MPLDGRPLRPHRYMTDEEIDRVIMEGSPFAIHGALPRGTTPPRRTLGFGDVLRGLLGLAMVFGVVACIGAAMMGLG